MPATAAFFDAFGAESEQPQGWRGRSQIADRTAHAPGPVLVIEAPDRPKTPTISFILRRDTTAPLAFCGSIDDQFQLGRKPGVEPAQAFEVLARA